jgi:23S rRNA-/tRNA-specific pseudouridylate synthase
VAVDKRAGILTVPSRMGSADPRPCLGRDLERALGVRLWPVHRLDVDVSGLVLFAKSAPAHRTASAAFESRRVRKTYEALTEGADHAPPLPATFSWQSRLVRGKRRTFEAPHGAPARTHARAIARLPAAGYVSAPPAADARPPPETGRTATTAARVARAGRANESGRATAAVRTIEAPEAISRGGANAPAPPRHGGGASGANEPGQLAGSGGAKESGQATSVVGASALELLHFVLEPETGRPHQLRVHLARAGFPVVGDALYGAATTWRDPAGIALRSIALELLAADDRAALGLPERLAVPGLLDVPTTSGQSG